MTTLQLDPPAPPRRSASTSCDLHPGETFTGFCAACLRERLAGLEASAAAASAPGRKSTSAIRSLFARPFAAAASSGAATAEPPDLRRCKSFSCGRGGDAFSTAAAAAAAAARVDHEPQRRSCDVRGRSTLWALFHQDDRDRVRDGTAFGAFPASSSAAAAALAADVVMPQPQAPQCVVPDDFMEEEEDEEDIPVVMESDEIIPVVEESFVAMDISGEIEEEDEANAAAAVEGNNNKAMKDHMDAEAASQQGNKKASPKDLKEIAGSFWVAASVFSKKWQKWRRKQKLKKEEATVSKAAAAAMPAPAKPPKPSFLLRRRGQRGDADVGGGARRSCDTDPRFSLDAARMSVDDAGFSWDEPRASWDGYLFGAGGGVGIGRAPPPLSRLPPILSVLEDTPTEIVERSDGQIPVEDDEFDPPGGSLQTRDYYLDSSSRRRRSLERTSSVRRPSFDVGALERTSSVRRPSFEVGGLMDPMPMSGPVVAESPCIGGSEFYHFHHAEDLLDRGFSSNSLIEDISASLEAALSGPAKKKPRRWSKAWSLWGLINRRAAAVGEGGRRGGGGGPADIADRSFSSNSGGLGSSRRSGYVVDANANANSRRRDQLEPQQVERNRSARYSPGRAAAAGDSNGMLRFYLTPMRRGGGVPSSKAVPGRPLTSQSFARSVLRMY
ncbi:hypothetical protein PR202_ga09012 [Eleusine coracana subsp. coracana]|uniref:Uncharacterized protein n=1 Tax=Eleusine coracana subsp. coracana TaxID=191504 RepID=A0AAV5C1S4_ELECO|nr:hypothetical protein PR202_ga09012 [Eleusine coracana subsp. coracana]